MSWSKASLLTIWALLVWSPLQAHNFILISVDTLRADRLGCYGYRENPTPSFDRWAREGIRFEYAYSETPLTLPAHSTLFLGVLPLSHGVRENAGFRLEESRTTLAERFQNAGYATAGFIGSYVLSSEFGMAQGFDTFDEHFDRPFESVNASTELQRTSDGVTESFLSWLDRHRTKAFFAFVHFYDPHMPRPRGYDWEVSRVDRNLGRIDTYLREHGLMERTTILLTSDHGESLGEHGESGHGFFIYDATLRIPLIIRPATTPTSAGRVFSEPVSLVDLMPTMLSMAGLARPEGMQGRSLLPLFSGGKLADAGIYAESHVPSLHFGWSALQSIRDGKFKFIAAPQPELYDISQDPREERNLEAEAPEQAAEMQARLRGLISQFRGAEPERARSEVDPEVLERLAALGYVSSGTVTRRQARLVDPKDRIEVFEEYHGLLNQLSSGGVPEHAPERFMRLRSKAPELKGVDFLEAWALELSDQLDDSARMYRRALAGDRDNLQARARYAGLLIRLQDYGEAEQQLQRILRDVPQDYRSRNNLAELYHLTGRSGQARSELEAIVRERPNYISAWYNLGRLLLAQRVWRGSEDSFRRVIALDPKHAVAHFALSQALAAQGRMDEARREREIAVGLDPRLESQR